MFDVAVVHVGPAKTGSTTIQHQAYLNRDGALDAAGLLYPAVDDGRRVLRNQSRHLEAMFIDDVVLTLPIMGPRDESGSAANTEQLFALYDELFASTTSRFLFVSGEHLGRAESHSIEAMTAWLSQYAHEVRYVAVARHPIEAAASLLQQRLNGGRTFDDAEDSVVRFSYVPRFARFAAVSPLTVVDYSQLFSAPEGPLVHLLGAVLPEATIGAVERGVRQANPSISHEGAYLLHALNRHRQTNNFVSGPLRFLTDARAFAQLEGGRFRPPGRLRPYLEEHTATELDLLESTYGVRPSPTKAIEFDDSGLEDAGWLHDAALHISDNENLAYLDAQVRKYGRRGDEAGVTNELREIARLLGIASWAEIDDPDVAARRSMKVVDNLGVYGAYERAKRKIEGHPDDVGASGADESTVGPTQRSS